MPFTKNDPPSRRPSFPNRIEAPMSAPRSRGSLLAFSTALAATSIPSAIVKCFSMARSSVAALYSILLLAGILLPGCAKAPAARVPAPAPSMKLPVFEISPAAFEDWMAEEGQRFETIMGFRSVRPRNIAIRYWPAEGAIESVTISMRPRQPADFSEFTTTVLRATDKLGISIEESSRLHKQLIDGPKEWELSFMKLTIAKSSGEGTVAAVVSPLSSN